MSEYIFIGHRLLGKRNSLPKPAVTRFFSAERFIEGAFSLDFQWQLLFWKLFGLRWWDKHVTSKITQEIDFWWTNNITMIVGILLLLINKAFLSLCKWEKQFFYSRSRYIKQVKIFPAVSKVVGDLSCVWVLWVSSTIWFLGSAFCRMLSTRTSIHVAHCWGDTRSTECNTYFNM